MNENSDIERKSEDVWVYSQDLLFKRDAKRSALFLIALIGAAALTFFLGYVAPTVFLPTWMYGFGVFLLLVGAFILFSRVSVEIDRKQGVAVKNWHLLNFKRVKKYKLSAFTTVEIVRRRRIWPIRQIYLFGPKSANRGDYTRPVFASDALNVYEASNKDSAVHCAHELASFLDFQLVGEHTDKGIESKLSFLSRVKGAPKWQKVFIGVFFPLILLVSFGGFFGQVVDYFNMPLHMAARDHQTRVAEFLIDYGANVDAKGPDGGTPLHYAAGGGSIAVAELLISAGADITAKNKERVTPLLIAIANNHAPVVELLISAGADISATDSRFGGDTPLHLAAYLGHDAVAELLIANGADVNVTNVNGMAPLHAGARKGRTAIVELLLANGANVNARDKQGGTPLGIAMSYSYMDVAKLLKEHGAEE